MCLRREAAASRGTKAYRDVCDIWRLACDRCEAGSVKLPCVACGQVVALRMTPSVSAELRSACRRLYEFALPEHSSFEYETGCHTHTHHWQQCYAWPFAPIKPVGRTTGTASISVGVSLRPRGRASGLHRRIPHLMHTGVLSDFELTRCTPGHGEVQHHPQSVPARQSGAHLPASSSQTMPCAYDEYDAASNRHAQRAWAMPRSVPPGDATACRRQPCHEEEDMLGDVEPRSTQGGIECVSAGPSL